MAAEFYNYKKHKTYWFMVFLEWAVTISREPALSVKNSDFKDYLAALDAEHERRFQRILWGE